MLYLVGFMAALMLVMVLLMRVQSSGQRRFVRGRITGVVGRMGDGKSLFACKQMLRHVQLKSIRDQATGLHHKPTLAANFTVNVPGHRVIKFTKWRDLLDMPFGTLVVMDEADMFAAAGQGSGAALPPHVRWLLKHLRKMGVELMWIAQHESRVALSLRQFTHTYVVAKKVSRWHHVGRYFEPENMRVKGAKPDWIYRYRATAELIAVFNTFELIEPDEDTNSAELVDLVKAKRAS